MRTKTLATKGGKEAGLDDLISAIRTGKAFGGGENSRRPRERANNTRTKEEPKKVEQPLKMKRTPTINALEVSFPDTRISRRLSVAQADPLNGSTRNSLRRMSIAQGDRSSVDSSNASVTTRGRRLSTAVKRPTVGDGDRPSLTNFGKEYTMKIGLNDRDRPTSIIKGEHGQSLNR
jgi:hypothetical protein